MAKLQRILLCCLAFVLCCSFHCSAQSAAEQDVLLNILQEKLSESYSQYAKQRVPCHALSFCVQESQKDSISINLGHLQADNGNQNIRELSISIVVGTPDRNNFQKKNCEKSYRRRIPLTNDKVVLGKLIDETLLFAYKEAVSEHYSVVRNALTNNEPELITLDFPSDTFHYEPPVSSQHYNKEEVLSKLITCTQLYSTVDEIEKFEGNLSFSPERTYYVNSLGAVIVHNTTSCNLDLSMSTFSEKETISYAVDYPDDLPPVEQLMTDASTLITRINTRGDAKKALEMPMLPRHYEPTESVEFFSDVIFKAMEDEISNDLNALNIKDAYQPYYISYLVTDAHIYQSTSVLGSTLNTIDCQKRYVEPTIRIGNNVINNEHLSSSSYHIFGNMVLDNDYSAIRNDLRTITMEAYKEAVDQFLEKQQQIEANGINVNKLIPNRSPADIKTNIQHKNYSKIDIGELQSITDELSALFLQDSIDPDIAANSTVSLYIHQGNTYYTSCERNPYAQSISICELELSYQGIRAMLYFETLDDISDRDSIIRWTKSFISNISQQQRNSNTIVVYTGPVMITGAAAGEWLSQAGSMLTTSYNRHDFLDKGLEQYIDQRICSPILDMQTADGLQEFEGTRLIGYNTFDAEGVLVNNEMELIRRGRLITLLNDRSPVENITYSNGHLRFNLKNNHYSTSIGPGVLKVKSRNSISDSKLNQLFLQKAKESGYEYAYIITDFYRDLIGNLKAVVQKVSVKDGKRQGVELTDVSENAFWSLRNVIATSQHTKCYNTMCSESDWFDCSAIRGIPTSIIHPESILFDHLTIGSKYAVNKK